MVGAIADWFAVTALFKHPLGLPIPHTALIPRRKDELGEGLEEFVGENFLQEEIIRDRIAAATISPAGRRAGCPSRPTPAGWSTRSPTSPRSGSARSATSTSRTWSTVVLVPRFREEPISPLLGGLLSRDGARRPPPRPGRPGARGAAPLAGATTRTPSPRCSASARRGGRRRGSTRRSPPRSTSRRSAGSPTSAPTRDHHARAGARLDAGPARRTTCCTTPTPRRGPRRSRSGCSSTRRCSPRAISLWNALRRALLAVAARPRRRRPAAAADRAGRASRERLRDDERAARPAGRDRRRRRGLRGRRATAPS